MELGPNTKGAGRPAPETAVRDPPPAAVDPGDRTRSIRELFTSRHAALAVGLLLLELSAGFSVYLSAAVTPSVIATLRASGDYPLIVSANSVGLFLALALARPVLDRFGPRPVLALGLALTVGGAALSALSPTAVDYALGRLAASAGGGLLGVFGTSTVIATMPQGYRVRLLALLSAMWIIPGAIGPALATAAVTTIGWRWTVVLVVPLTLVARTLVGRAAVQAVADRTPAADHRSGRRLLLALLLPAGMALFVFGSATSLGPWALIGLVPALVGAAALLPPGTLRAAPGIPHAMALLLLIAFGLYGIDGLLTTIGTRADHLALLWPSLAIGAMAVGWSMASMVQPRLSGPTGLRATAVLVTGVVVLAGAAVTIVVLQAAGVLLGPVLLAVWTVGGGGMGLAYPVVYLRATTVPDGSADPNHSPAALATAVTVAENVGGLVGTAIGAAVVDLVQRVGRSEAAGLHLTTAVYAGVLVLAALVSARWRHGPNIAR